MYESFLKNTITQHSCPVSFISEYMAARCGPMICPARCLQIEHMRCADLPRSALSLALRAWLAVLGPIPAELGRPSIPFFKPVFSILPRPPTPWALLSFSVATCPPRAARPCPHKCSSPPTPSKMNAHTPCTNAMLHDLLTESDWDRQSCILDHQQLSASTAPPDSRRHLAAAGHVALAHWRQRPHQLSAGPEGCRFWVG